MDEDSNIDEFCGFLSDLVNTFGFESAGVTGKSLGDDAVAAVAESISEDAREGIDPDGQAWAPNKEPYKTRKAKKFGVHDPGYRTGETLSLKALTGEVTVTNDSVSMSHGTGAVDQFGASDKDKGKWLSEGDPARNRPERKFYNLNDKRNEKVAEVMREGLGRHIEAKTRS